MELDLGVVTTLALKIRHMLAAARVAGQDGVWPMSVLDTLDAIKDGARATDDGHVDDTRCWCKPSIDDEGNFRHNYRRPEGDDEPSEDSEPIFEE